MAYYIVGDGCVAYLFLMYLMISWLIIESSLDLRYMVESIWAYLFLIS